MRKHLEDRALHGNVVERENAEDDEPEVADAGVSDEFFQVGLNERDQRAIDDSDDREHGDGRREAA